MEGTTASDGKPAPRWSHVGVCVADLERSLRFYCEGLGFRPAERYELDDTAVPGLAGALEVGAPVELVSQMITAGDCRIELLGWRTPSPGGVASASRGQLGLTHLTFVVGDVDEVADRLVGLGGTLLPGTDTDLGVTRLLFLADPDGTRIELMRG